MKITDEVIDAWREAHVVRDFSRPFQITTYEERAAEFFSQQATEDILDYVNSRKPLEEWYLQAALTECARRADMFDQWMNMDGEFDDIWREISRRLRRQIRESKKNADKTE
ncbi:MAG: hypothetical protein K5705_08065 [Oscillospiraceae bacterium]|nr:hypothetical protein [Oscillospiraceae bacterium]MCR4760203.1 hypothetical protein [Oscillospiraceae bacterium]